MQKIRKFNRNVYEIGVRVKLRYIYGTNTRNRAGPLPRPHGLNMHIQRPPRGQAWPHGRSWSWIRRFQLNLFGNLSLFTLLVHLIVIGQCPSGTEFGDNIVQFNFFSVLSFFQRTSGLRQRSISNFSSSVWAFCGDEPHKICSQFFFNFWKKFYVQKSWKLFFRFWVKKLCISM